MLLLIIIIICRLKFFIFDKDRWLMIFLLIFTLGGLMISFFYLVRLCQNELILSLQFNSLLIYFTFFYIFFWNKNNFIMNFEPNLNINFFYNNFNIWRISSYGYLVLVFLLLIYLILVLIFIDQKLKIFKGNLNQF